MTEEINDIFKEQCIQLFEMIKKKRPNETGRIIWQAMMKTNVLTEFNGFLRNDENDAEEDATAEVAVPQYHSYSSLSSSSPPPSSSNSITITAYNGLKRKTNERYATIEKRPRIILSIVPADIEQRIHILQAPLQVLPIAITITGDEADVFKKVKRYLEIIDNADYINELGSFIFLLGCFLYYKIMKAIKNNSGLTYSRLRQQLMSENQVTFYRHTQYTNIGQKIVKAQKNFNDGAFAIFMSYSKETVHRMTNEQVDQLLSDLYQNQSIHHKLMGTNLHDSLKALLPNHS